MLASLDVSLRQLGEVLDAGTCERRVLASQSEETSGDKVKRISANGGCLGGQRR